jgi:predicted exporter
VGLDDTFIITGAYFRTDPEKEPAERIREVMQEVGLSISVTTMTTVVAFILGCISSIPAIRWLNFYAIPAILMDFVFQLTFFIGMNHCFECLSVQPVLTGRHCADASFSNSCEHYRIVGSR